MLEATGRVRARKRLAPLRLLLLLLLLVALHLRSQRRGNSIATLFERMDRREADANG